MKEFKKKLKSYSLKPNETDFPCVKISCSKDAADYARNFYYEDLTIYESFFVMYLNNANNTVGYVKISQGGITGTIVDVKLVIKHAIDSLCMAMILVHNHPSGTLRPSEADKRITEKIKKAAQFFDIKTLDHIILTEESYLSMADDGIL